MTDPTFVAKYDQALAQADAGLDELIGAYRIVNGAYGEIDNAAGLVAILAERAPMDNVSLLLVAVRRLAQQSAEVTA